MGQHPGHDDDGAGVGPARDLVARLPAGFHRRRAARDPDGAGRPPAAAGSTGWLDYAVELGASGLALGPVFASETHGYDTVDHLRDRPAARRRRRLRPRWSPPPTSAACGCCSTACSTTSGGATRRSAGAASRARRAPTAAWFRLTGPTAPVGTSRTTTTFEGHDALVALDHDEPAVVDHVVDGDEPLARPRRRRLAARRRLRRARRRSGRRCCRGCASGTRTPAFVGEVIHGDYAGVRRRAPAWTRSPSTSCGRRSGARSTTRNFFELDWTPRAGTTSSSTTFVPLTFVGNHDVTRIASRLTDGRHLRARPGRADHRRRHAGGLLRRRAGVPRGQGGPGRRRRRGPARRSPPTPAGLVAVRLADLPPAPGADRAAPAAPLAAPRADDARCTWPTSSSPTRPWATGSGWWWRCRWGTGRPRCPRTGAGRVLAGDAEVAGGRVRTCPRTAGRSWRAQPCRRSPCPT